MLAPRRAPTVTELQAIFADLQADRARMAERIAELEHPPSAPKIALKLAAYNGGIMPERLGRWCINQKVDAEQIGAQWFVNEHSLAERMLSVVGHIPTKIAAFVEQWYQEALVDPVFYLPQHTFKR